VDFAVTRHAAQKAPPDALERLWARIEGRRFEDVTFLRTARDIRAASGHDSPISMERDEREATGRGAVLDCVREICEEAPELPVDWYAVSPRR
jgi:RNA:NAD 2'-phosphotransferase (TPT1/KptA family)